MKASDECPVCGVWRQHATRVACGSQYRKAGCFLAAAVSATSTEPGVAEEAEGVGRIPPDAPVGRDTDEGRTDLASRSLDVPGSVGAAVSPTPEEAAAAVREALCAYAERKESAGALWRRGTDALAALDVLVAALRDAREAILACIGDAEGQEAVAENRMLELTRGQVQLLASAARVSVAPAGASRASCCVAGSPVGARPDRDEVAAEELRDARRERDQARDVLARISDPSYVGNYDAAAVVEIYRKWAAAALGGAAEGTGP